MGSRYATRLHAPGCDQDFDVPDAPLLVQWMATSACAYSCPHCLCRDSEYSSPDMPLAAVLRLVDESRAIGVGEFLVTGGEPLAREDLPEVIRRLGEAGQRWSLNTARLPASETADAMRRHPPGFVAVSLDGPRDLHDRFRGRAGAFDEALESMRFFASLGVPVAAGTTVTAESFDHLEETFGVVLASGASTWGLHVVVAEGAARSKPRLLLDRRRQEALFDYVERRRNYFPVQLADEFGYCGPREPAFRDHPWTCGAGRLQCVVLPGGEVVPCTLMDLSTSAGSVLKRPLADIWRDGFAEFRPRRASGKCRSCEHFSSCGGGCWLASRSGHGCSKPIWSIGKPLTAAAMAVCFGLACTTPPPAVEAPANEPLTASEVEVAVERPRRPQTDENIDRRIWSIDRMIGRWYGQDLDHPRFLWVRPQLEDLPVVLREDPGWVFFADFVHGRLPAGVGDRAMIVREAMRTNEVSLALAALLWRSLAEAALDGPLPFQRPAKDFEALQQALFDLGRATHELRSEVFTRRIGPFLSREKPYAFLSKAGPRESDCLEVSALTRRWPKEVEEITTKWLTENPYAADMQLELFARSSGLVVRSPNAERMVWPEEKFLLGIFDVVVPLSSGCRITVVRPERTVSESSEQSLGHSGRRRAMQPEDSTPKTLPRLEIELLLTAPNTWPDIVRMAFELQREALTAEANRLREKRMRWEWPPEPLHPEPLHLPAMRADPESARRLAYFWMF